MKKILLIAAAAVVTFSASAQKFAHVNYAELVMLMPEADEARTVLAASQKEAEETFQGMYEEYQSKFQQYQQKAESWTAAVRQSKEKELGDIQNRLQEFQQTIQQELAQQQNMLMAPIQQKALEAVEKLAKAGGYIYVFDVTGSSLLYLDDKQSTDLTPAARKELNIPDGRTLEALQAELQAQAAL